MPAIQQIGRLAAEQAGDELAATLRSIPVRFVAAHEKNIREMLRGVVLTVAEAPRAQMADVSRPPCEHPHATSDIAATKKHPHPHPNHLCHQDRLSGSARSSPAPSAGWQ